MYEGGVPQLTTPCWCAQSIEGQMTGSGPGDVALRLSPEYLFLVASAKDDIGADPLVIGEERLGYAPGNPSKNDLHSDI